MFYIEDDPTRQCLKKSKEGENASVKIHGDIEYYYEVVVSNSETSLDYKNSKIELKTYKVSFDDFRKKNLIKTMKIKFNRIKGKEYDDYEWGLPIKREMEGIRGF